MPSVEIENPPAPPSSPYASAADLTPLLGNLAGRLPDWVDVDAFLAIAHAQVVEAVGRFYPTSYPDLAGPGLLVVRYAEAKLTAAEILSAIRINLPPDAQEVPEKYREDALATLSGPIVGYPVDTTEVDDDGDPDTPGVRVGSSPRVSSYTSLSAFEDPYAAARVYPGSEASW